MRSLLAVARERATLWSWGCCCTATASGFSRAQLWRARCTQQASTLSMEAAVTQLSGVQHNVEGSGRQAARVTGVRGDLEDSELDTDELSHAQLQMAHLMLTSADS